MQLILNYFQAYKLRSPICSIQCFMYYKLTNITWIKVRLHLHALEPVLHNEPLQGDAHSLQPERSPRSPQLERSLHNNEDPAQPNT